MHKNELYEISVSNLQRLMQIPVVDRNDAWLIRFTQQLNLAIHNKPDTMSQRDVCAIVDPEHTEIVR